LHRQCFLVLEDGKLAPTHLGKAALASSIAPEESYQIFSDLYDARLNCLILETDLHLLYLITPFF
jgi:DNA polymerase theta